ncbi:MAG: 4-hydroxy-tetrahydrodipicolinate reductase [Candidatus Eisenbacteria sp.]|nr:4-hydroxy-tetrahydrodipicolinate reductase [Candidatus Eisenbacteria bacterium]
MSANAIDPGTALKIALWGAAGRMGGRIAAAIAAAPDLVLAVAAEHEDHPAIGNRVGEIAIVPGGDASLEECGVVIDFSVPAAAVDVVARAASADCAYVSGVTGLGEDQLAALARAAATIAVLHAANMSRGIGLLTRLAAEAAGGLPGYDIEIVEMHHRRKRDAPSGTALQLAAAIEQVRRGLRRIHGRSGVTGQRDAGELGLHALRGGDVVGEHRVIFAGPGERLVLTHHAESREAFVAGVLAAVRFVVEQPAGRYTMSDVLGLTAS